MNRKNSLARCILKILVLVITLYGIREYIIVPIFLESLRPKVSVLTQIDSKDYYILEQEMGIIIPKDTRVTKAYISASHDGTIGVCIADIQDVEKFIKQSCFIQTDGPYCNSYHSFLLGKYIDDAVYYEGYNIKDGPRKGKEYKKKVIKYVYEGTQYIEIITPAYYEDKTYDFFFKK